MDNAFKHVLRLLKSDTSAVGRLSDFVSGIVILRHLIKRPAYAFLGPLP